MPPDAAAYRGPDVELQGVLAPADRLGVWTLAGVSRGRGGLPRGQRPGVLPLISLRPISRPLCVGALVALAVVYHEQPRTTGLALGALGPRCSVLLPSVQGSHTYHETCPVCQGGLEIRRSHTYRETRSGRRRVLDALTTIQTNGLRKRSAWPARSVAGVGMASCAWQSIYWVCTAGEELVQLKRVRVGCCEVVRRAARCCNGVRGMC